MPSDRDDSAKPAGPNGQSPVNGTAAHPAAPQPFARRAVQWGRPPQTTFRAGPLPKGETLPPLPPMPPLDAPKARPPRPATDFFSGSMIPRAQPAAATTPVARPEVLPEPTPTPNIETTPLPDMTVRPLPSVAATPPAAMPTTAIEPTPVEREPIVPDTPAAAPVVAPIASAGRTVRKSSKTPLYVGVAAVVVVGIAATVWLTSRGGSVEAPVTTTPVAATPAPTLTPIDAAPAPVDSLMPPVAVSAPTTRPAATRPTTTTTTPRATRTVPARQAPASTQTETPSAAATPPPASAAQTPAITVAPLVVVVPPAGPPPTAAQAPSNDPDAPIVTRPQPLE